MNQPQQYKAPPAPLPKPPAHFRRGWLLFLGAIVMIVLGIFFIPKVSFNLRNLLDFLPVTNNPRFLRLAGLAGALIVGTLFLRLLMRGNNK